MILGSLYGLNERKYMKASSNLVPEKAMAPHYSTLAWKIPWMEDPGRLQSMGSRRVGHDWATSLSCIGEGNGNPLQCSCLENPRDRGAWWAAIYGVAQSQTRLKRLSSSSSSSSNLVHNKFAKRNSTFDCLVDQEIRTFIFLSGMLYSPSKVILTLILVLLKV